VKKVHRYFDISRNIVYKAVMRPAQAVAALGALAHETRLGAFRKLVERAPEGMPAGLLAEKLRVPPSSLTFHLQQLAHVGLVTQRRLGRQVIYAVDVAAMNALMGYLTDNCCGGEAALCAPVCQPQAIKKGKAA
jgi:DNA-binding transcriptional ArsR family regulator